MKYVAVIEGQEIDLPEEIAQKDDLVKQSLQPYFPDVANALITRETTDERVTIKIVKRAGSKGGRSFEELVQAKDGRNPLVVIYQGIGGSNPDNMPLDEILRWEGRIERAIHEGKEQNESMEFSRRRLIVARPAISTEVPTGF